MTDPSQTARHAARPAAPAGARGGIDLGGTKIEARLFGGSDARGGPARRLPTPQGGFDALMGALADQIAWLEAEAGRPDLPVGVAVPGILDPRGGAVIAANLPLAGHRLGAELEARTGRPVAVINDAMAFALSEARGGAGDGARSVLGLVIGTGLGAGLCLDGAPAPRHSGLAVEVGHMGIPARALGAHGLPLFDCGCGRRGCFEGYLSGTGLSNIAEWRLGRRVPADEIRDESVLGIWADIAGECLAALQLLLDPEAIVLGGGVSGMAGIEDRLSDALAAHALAGARAPRIVRAVHGDASGARGAALMAC